jgi:hypothetical protein
MEMTMQYPHKPFKLRALAMLMTLGVGMCAMTVTTTATGCTAAEVATQIKNDGAAVAAAAENVATALQATDSSLASKLEMAAQALQAVTQNFTAGSAVAYINDAANAVEVILALIPITAPFAALIPIVVAAIDLLIANLPAPTSTSLVGTRKVIYNPYRTPNVDKLITHRFGRSKAGDIKAAFNKLATAHPEWKVSPVQ